MPDDLVPLVTSEAESNADDWAQQKGPEKGTALCLSGGGYRAMLFHLGTILYLNECGWLAKMDRISSVSGGSITAAVLGMNWSQLKFTDGRASNFRELVVEPLRDIARTTIDASSIIGGIFSPDTIAEWLTNRYRRELFGNATLQDLPDKPRFVFNATNVQSGALFRFSKPYIWDYRVGKIANPTRLLAEAVAASSAFPPFLSPVRLDLSKEVFVPGTGTDLQRPPFTTEAVLTDGGVYDNIGIETAWKRYTRILVSDAGAKMPAEKEPESDWARHSLRINSIIDNQVRSLRKRQLLASFENKEREGAYWGVRSDMAKYPVSGALPCPLDRTMKLAGVPTRLKSLGDDLQERLINWGFAICDAAMRLHVDPALAAPAGFPYSVGV
ncbi:MAG: patatin-like phospholipase family protein [Thermoanaerobaculia bacterium]